MARVHDYDSSSSATTADLLIFYSFVVCSFRTTYGGGGIDGQSSDMPQEMVQEAVEIVTMSVDKFINVKNYEVMENKSFK